jgi:hypothetical protein
MSYNKLKKNYDDKCSFYLSYINRDNLSHQLLDTSRKCTFNINTYINLFCLLEATGVSYNNFYLILDSINSEGDRFPRKSSLNHFSVKLAKLKVSENLFNNYVIENNKVDDVCIIDSTVIPNKCNSTIATNFGYKGKRGIKLHQITNKNGFPLVCSITDCSVNDAKAGYNLINENFDLLKNTTFYADKGYDSSEIKHVLDNNNCKYIIPKNSRNTDNSFVANMKKIERDKINKKRKMLMKRQKKLNKKKKVDDIDNILKEFNEIKTLRHNLKKELKENINKKINDLKDKKCTINTNSRKCTRCENMNLCNICNICNKCGLNLKYYNGIEDDEIKNYNKIRIRVEHFNSHFKNGRMINVTNKKYMTLKNAVYCKLLDFVIRDMKKDFG